SSRKRTSRYASTSASRTSVTNGGFRSPTTASASSPSISSVSSWCFRGCTRATNTRAPGSASRFARRWSTVTTDGSGSSPCTAKAVRSFSRFPKLKKDKHECRHRQDRSPGGDTPGRGQSRGRAPDARGPQRRQGLQQSPLGQGRGRSARLSAQARQVQGRAQAGYHPARSQSAEEGRTRGAAGDQVRLAAHADSGRGPYHIQGRGGCLEDLHAARELLR